MKGFFILLLIVFQGVLFAQSNTEQSGDTIRTATSVRIIKKNNTKQTPVITQEDTVITTPTSKRIVKKKDFYQENLSQKEIVVNQEDSVIVTPTYKRIIRKNKSK